MVQVKNRLRRGGLEGWKERDEQLNIIIITDKLTDTQISFQIRAVLHCTIPVFVCYFQVFFQSLMDSAKLPFLPLQSSSFPAHFPSTGPLFHSLLHWAQCELCGVLRVPACIQRVGDEWSYCVWFNGQFELKDCGRAVLTTGEETFVKP